MIKNCDEYFQLFEKLWNYPNNKNSSYKFGEIILVGGQFHRNIPLKKVSILDDKD